MVKKNDTGRLFIYLLYSLKVGDSGRAGSGRGGFFFGGEARGLGKGGCKVVERMTWLQ